MSINKRLQENFITILSIVKVATTKFNSINLDTYVNHNSKTPKVKILDKIDKSKFLRRYLISSKRKNYFLRKVPKTTVQ